LPNYFIYLFIIGVNVINISVQYLSVDDTMQFKGKYLV